MTEAAAPHRSRRWLVVALAAAVLLVAGGAAAVRSDVVGKRACSKVGCVSVFSLDVQTITALADQPDVVFTVCIDGECRTEHGDGRFLTASPEVDASGHPASPFSVADAPVSEVVHDVTVEVARPDGSVVAEATWHGDQRSTQPTLESEDCLPPCPSVAFVLSADGRLTPA